jgi:hypothetical protein
MERSDIDSSEALSPKVTAGGQDQTLKTETLKGRLLPGGRDLAGSGDLGAVFIGRERRFPGRFAKRSFGSLLAAVVFGTRLAGSGVFEN